MVCCATMPGNCVNSRRKCAGFMMTCVAILFVTWFLYNSSIDMAPTSMSYGTSNTSKARETDWRRSTSAILTQAKNRSQLQNSSYTRVADPHFSEIRINGRYQFQVGDVINVSIILKDREGRMIVTGGDDIRIWMKSTNGRNRTSGHVIDHGNGSYTGVLRAFWEGHPVITVSIAWTRQHLNIKDRFLSSHVPYNFLYASFESGSLKEVTRCNITKTSENMCDFTAQNGGHPWLCERPKEKRLPCSSRKSHHSATAGDYHTPAEKQFLKRHPAHQFLRTITASISRGIFRPVTRISCSELPVNQTWRDDFASGYSSQERNTRVWHPHLCRYPIQQTEQAYKRCLTNRRLWLYGDSTTRQWFGYLSRLLGKEMVIHGKYEPKVSFISDTNSSIFCGPHEYPFNIGSVWTNATFNKPLKQYLDKIPNHSTDIVVFHQLAHLVNFGPDVFRDHIRRNVGSIREFIFRVPKAIVVVKGTTTFRTFVLDKFGDMNAMSYDPILREEFSLIKDRVIFLDFIPMTLASEVQELHPDKEVVKLMVHHLMGNVCGRN